MGSEKNQNSVWYALSLAWELGYMIALPIAVLGFLGAYLDNKYQTRHWLLGGGVVLSILISAFSVYRKVKSLS